MKRLALIAAIAVVGTAAFEISRDLWRAIR